MYAGRAVACCKRARTSFAVRRKQSTARLEAEEEVEAVASLREAAATFADGIQRGQQEHDVSGGLQGLDHCNAAVLRQNTEGKRPQALASHQAPAS